MSLPTLRKNPARVLAPSAPWATNAASTGGVAKHACHGSSGSVSNMVLTTCAMVSSPTTSAVRNVALLARPIAGPVSASTMSKPRPKACVWCIVASTEKMPMRLAMKFGVSLARMTPLPSVVVRNDSSRSSKPRVGLRRGDQLDQVHVARRIEEVHAAEAAAHRRRHGPGQRRQREAGSVGREDRVCSQVRGDLFVQIALPVEALGNGLDDQVASCKQAEVGSVVCGRNGAGAVLAAQRRGFELRQRGDRLGHHRVGVAFLRWKVEQHDRDVRVDQVRRDLGTHDAGTEHGNPANEERC